MNRRSFEGRMMEPIPDYGDLFPAEEFDPICCCPEDGSGYWATATDMSGLDVFGPKPDWATHVMWFNK